MDGHGAAHIDDTDRRTLVNAQGAIQVVQTTSESVDERLQRLLDRATKQETGMTDAADAVSELSATIEEIAASAEQVENRSQTAPNRAEEGDEAARRAAERLDSIHSQMSGVRTELQSLLDRIDEIELALSGTTCIAEQTNMLALNASIEAARADNSEGFAVVADEVESLAAESQEYADDIEDVLGALRSAADSTDQQLEAALTEVDQSTDEVQAAVENLGAVADAVDETATEIAGVSDAIDEQARVSQSVVDRCTTAAERATEMTTTVDDIDQFRAEQTAMLEEIDDALTEATPALSVADIERIPTGIEPLDDATEGGLLLGGQSVIQHETPVVDVVATLCGSALAAGLQRHGSSLTSALTDDRVLVLDMFDEWDSERNVSDVADRSLAAVNRETVTRRDEPLLVVGNIAGEIAVLGEERARQARYENDSTVFDPADTVCNVVDKRTVDESFGAFYAGAADQVLELTTNGDERRLALRSSPTGPAQPRPLTAANTPVSSRGD